MKLFAIALSLSLASLLSGCATPLPLNTLKYEDDLGVRSSKEATVVVVSGPERGSEGSGYMPAGGVFIPIVMGPNPELQFHGDDQQEFAQSLRTELVRTGVLKAAEADDGRNRDFKIRIFFAQTQHYPTFQQYALEVVVEMTGGKEPALKHYRILSSDKDTTWEKWNTNAYQGKQKAAKLLLDELMPDIATYIAES